MNQNSDEKIFDEIKKSLDYLDSKTEVKVPHMNHFRQLVANVEENKQKRRNRQFFIFLISAAVILSIEIFLFYKSSTFFLILQAVTFVSMPVVVYVWLKQNPRQVKKYEPVKN